MRPDWWPDWSGQVAIIVGGGPSAAQANLYARRARIITVNNGYILAPHADVAYACDARWWREHNGLPWFKGLKISQDQGARQSFTDVHLVNAMRGSDEILLDDRGVIGWGGNGGFQAINLAAQFGVKQIRLVGFEMSYEWGEHWHAPHPWELPAKEANVARHRRAVDAAADTLRAAGIDPVNMTPQSALTNWRRLKGYK